MRPISFNRHLDGYGHESADGVCLRGECTSKGALFVHWGNKRERSTEDSSLRVGMIDFLFKYKI